MRLPLPESLRDPTGCTATFGDGLQLMQVVGRDDTIDFYWLTTADVTGDALGIEVILADPASGHAGLPVQEAVWTPAGPGLMSKVTIDDPRLDDAPPLSAYTLTIQVRERTTGTLLPVGPGQEGEVAGQFTTTSECYYSG